MLMLLAHFAAHIRQTRQTTLHRWRQMTDRYYVVCKIHLCIKFELKTSRGSPREIDTKVRSFFYKKKPMTTFYCKFINNNFRRREVGALRDSEYHSPSAGKLLMYRLILLCKLAEKVWQKVIKSLILRSKRAIRAVASSRFEHITTNIYFKI